MTRKKKAKWMSGFGGNKRRRVIVTKTTRRHVNSAAYDRKKGSNK